MIRLYNSSGAILVNVVVILLFFYSSILLSDGFVFFKKKKHIFFAHFNGFFFSLSFRLGIFKSFTVHVVDSNRFKHLVVWRGSRRCCRRRPICNVYIHI